jgi:peptidyl-prolyl cis-trans isomerase SurA
MRLLSFVLLAVTVMAQPLMAQGLFSPVITVNDDVITRYELNQRVSMLEALGARGDLREQAIDGLIADRVRTAEAGSFGLVATEAQTIQALEEFAARNSQTVDGVLGVLAARGVTRETLRDFVTANFIWQSLIRQRFAGSTSVSEAEVDAALAATGESTNLRVLVSEIVLPLIEGQEQEIRKLADDIAKLRSQDEFSSAARQFSVAASRADGGQLDWLSLSNLPPALRPVLLPLAIGEVSQPLELPNAVALFQMRGLSEAAPTSGSVSSIEYGLVSVAATDGTPELAALSAIADRALRCDDLYGLSQGITGAQVAIRTQLPNDLPRRESLWLARLDAGETLVDTTTDDQGATVANLVMLCSRTSAANRDASRDEVRLRLLNEKLNARADSLTESLKATARIKYQ